MQNKDYVSVRFEPMGKTRQVKKGTPLIDLVNEYGMEFPCGGKGTCGGCRVKILDGKINRTDKHLELLKKTGLEENEALGCQVTIDYDVTLELLQLESLILTDNTPFDFKPGEGHAIAIDLGSSTIVAQLLSLKTGVVKDVISRINPQVRYGADIMSRIEFAVHQEGHGKLVELIRQEIGRIVKEILAKNHVTVKKIGLVGNTVMHHIFCDIDLSPLSMYPYESKDTGIKKFTPGHLGWDKNIQAEIIFYPSIGSFVGSDILAGIFTTGIYKAEKYNILIDLGTNGEIAIGNRNGILCASTAAGPAFEGATISMGMKASAGAVSSIDKNGSNGLAIHTVSNMAPIGICGSGLIDAISVFVEQGKIDETGLICNEHEKIEIIHPVYITQRDVREFQLAKSAMRTGIHIILEKSGIKYDDIDNVYFAGGFGNFVNIQNIKNTGLLDKTFKNIHKAGNTALNGVKQCMFKDDAEIMDVLRKCSHLSLESDPNFQDHFANNMFFFQQ
jgi:uncharacterized 2Fe-2S/4Fe-4S cluster protein (DUF4445 family)